MRDSKLDNPLGCDGFEFIEYSVPNHAEKQKLVALFEGLGFAAIADHRSKDVTLLRQGEINFLVNAEPYSHFSSFAKAHGSSVCSFAFKVKDARKALAHALSQGAREFEGKADYMELRIPAIYGIGESVLYFVDNMTGVDIYHVDFIFREGVDHQPNGVGLEFIDHLTHNVERGNMDVWSDFYTRIGNFQEAKYFDIKGKATGLASRAMSGPDGKIRIPINESQDEKSQIHEYLIEYRGEGVQHIALHTPDIYATMRSLRAAGVAFQRTNDAYYAMIDQRIPGHGEDLEQLQALQILIDGAPGDEGLLLQIFTENAIGPVFFEIIQRKGNQGFGEGNFQALFESIEADQIRRGVI
ncbi:MAG: 4-hydroxyphenylpyruvate dioxygenase [Cellvibrionaceae bacterium]|nr:4-hydroxyphenylpyruvate dioxygenase [Cellvibrionaceae bacterium]